MTGQFVVHSGQGRHPSLAIALLALWSILLPCALDVSQAQVTTLITPTTGTGNLGTVITPAGNTYNITGGTRPGAGTNLFHSFGRFEVGQTLGVNDIANFVNDMALPTNNILGRVTDGFTSQIYGTLQMTGFGNAALWLINPAGVVFGATAQLNVGGPVNISTADYLRLNDAAGIFYADPAKPTMLTSAPVEAFGFLSSTPQAITVQGLTAPTGGEVTLVGGNVNATGGTFTAPGGKINLASAASAGEVELTPTFQLASGTQGGTVSLSGGALIDVSGNAAGTVVIRGGALAIVDSRISADTVNSNGASVAIDINVSGDISISTVDIPALTARTTGSGGAGEIRLSSNNMDVAATGLNNFFVSAIDTHTSGSGKAGDVTITATNALGLTGDPSFFVTAVDSGTTGPAGGQGGNVTLTANNIDLQRANVSTGDFVATNLGDVAAGSAGNLTMTADTIRVTNSALAADALQGGQGGVITISARDVQMNQFSALTATGIVMGGAIHITADHLALDATQFEVDTLFQPAGGIFISARVAEITNGSTIATQAFGDGAAGDIRVTASDHLTLADDPTSVGAAIRPSGFFTNSLGFFSTGSGNAGAIVVTTPRLEITGGARFDSTTNASGPAGPITITADSVVLSGGRTAPILETQFNQGGLSSGIYSRSVDTGFCVGLCGNGGPISITAGALSVNQGARIDSSTTSTGRGGDIAIFAGQSVALSSGSSITANSTGVADAGNIMITAVNSFTMTNSSVTTQASLASGGNVTIKAGELISLNHSQINTSVAGGPTTAGGDIMIDPPFVVLQNNSQILAQAFAGLGGNISIVAGALFIDPTSTISASSQLGISGSVNVQTPVTFLSGTFSQLPKNPLQAASLLQAHCAARLQGNQDSSFVQRGRDGLPPEPGGWMASPMLAAAGLTELQVGGNIPASMEEAAPARAHAETGPVLLADARVGPMVGTMPANGSAGCGL